MARLVKKHYRNSHTRTRKKTIVIACEGKRNRTEKSYFTGLERRTNSCHFVFAEGKTDPVGIVKVAKQKADSLDLIEGDRVYAVFDVDNDERKIEKIAKAYKLAEEYDNDIQIITSNPSFEIWLLLHFICTTKAFKDSKEVEEHLKKHFPNYNKSSFNMDVLFPKIDFAIKNSEKLCKYHRSTYVRGNDYWNPSSMVYMILKDNELLK